MLLRTATSVHPTVLAVASIPQVITNITNVVAGLLAGAATLSLTIGGLRHLLSAGDPGEVSAAKRAYKEAAFGYLIAVLAPALVALLKTVVGAS
ncbi:pilin [Actinospica durhamensis]|uniref:pilin n=1 Tax=Actinospica durhamensis TaxID=1508375 RepID=UPI0027DD4C81|nr:hypothetical protein [Actinospica durhamensis]